jgi:hypothetical protein
VVDGVEFWTRPEIPDLPASVQGIPHKLEDGERLEHLSLKYYGREDWDWVIAYKNNLTSLPTGMKPGMILLIPDAATVREKLF